MLKEITRRREYIKRMEQRAAEFQKECRLEHEEELREREAFKQTYGVNLPPICPALDVRVTTSLLA